MYQLFNFGLLLGRDAEFMRRFGGEIKKRERFLTEEQRDINVLPLNELTVK